MNEEMKFGMANIKIQGPDGEAIEFNSSETTEITPIENDITVSDFGAYSYEGSCTIESTRKNTIFLLAAWISVDGKRPEYHHFIDLELSEDMPEDEFKALETKLKDYAAAGKVFHLRKREGVEE